MIGKPKYKVGDRVSFKIKDDGKDFIVSGKVYIVDAYGTFEQNEEPSYDVWAEESHYDEDSSCLYKHVRESSLL